MACRVVVEEMIFESVGSINIFPLVFTGMKVVYYDYRM